MTTYTKSTEIRQVLQFELDGLVSVLEDNWRELFFLIPKQIADIDREMGTYVPKYNGAQESELNAYGEAQNISRARLLLDEWGTSGRKEERPTLGHLYTLVTKGCMFRAADHIAINLLKIPKPERPDCGPAAPINVDLALDLEIEKQLEDVAYPNSTALQNGDTSMTVVNNLDYDLPAKRGDVVNPPQAVPDSIIEGSLPVFSRSDNNDQSIGVVPMISELLRGEEQTSGASISGGNSTPRQIIEGNTVSSTSDSVSESSDSSSISTPSEPNSRVLPMVLPTIPEVSEVPNLSMFGPAASRENMDNGIPAISDLIINSEDQGVSNDLPRFSVIGQSEESTSESNSYSTEQQNTNDNGERLGTSNLIEFSAPSVTAVPPLINFSLPFLKTVTADFDTKHFTNRNPLQPDGRILGVGGFGEVFLALNLTSSYPVSAVKRLKQSNYKGNCREKFDKEREILSKYHHPNIVKLIGFSEDATLCLVYEYLPDGTLGAALDHSRKSQLLLTASRRINYLLGIAAALEYLHSPLVKVIHRDVSLANILLDGDTAKLCDFGLVKPISSMTTTAVGGTGPYMAPEAMRGTITPALDVYSYGIVLAEAVTGEEVLPKVLPDGVRDLIERVTAMGADLESMVDRRVLQDELNRWMKVGKRLLELSNLCLQERFQRPSASAVRESVQLRMQELSQ